MKALARLLFSLCLPLASFAGIPLTRELTEADTGATLTNGLYQVPADLTLTAGGTTNGLSVASGSTVVVYVPKGHVLNVCGGDAVKNAGAGAGISVPDDSRLILCGEGAVTAVGGSAAAGGDGANATGATQGGAGGRGGGGAGSGIGSSGSAGGSGGRGGNDYGKSGEDGCGVSAADRPGIVHAVGSLVLTGRLGLGGDGGKAGAYYTNETGKKTGGGGGGGGGSPAPYGIGYGGSGGGGGGGGGCYNWNPGAGDLSGGAGQGGAANGLSAGSREPEEEMGASGGWGGQGGTQSATGAVPTWKTGDAEIDGASSIVATNAPPELVWTIGFTNYDGRVVHTPGDITACLSLAYPGCEESAAAEEGRFLLGWADLPDGGNLYFRGNTPCRDRYDRIGDVLLYPQIVERFETGLFIDGEQVTTAHAQGEGWNYDFAAGRITLTGREEPYGIAGSNERSFVTFDITGDATLCVTTLTMRAGWHPTANGFISLATNATVTIELDGHSVLSSAHDGMPAIACPPGSALTLKAAGAVPAPIGFEYLPTNGFYRVSVNTNATRYLPSLTVAGGRGAAAIGGSVRAANGACGIVNIHSNVCVYATGGAGAADIGAGSPLGSGRHGRGCGPVAFAGIPLLYRGTARESSRDVRIVPHPHNAYLRALTVCDDCCSERLWLPIGTTAIGEIDPETRVWKPLKVIHVFPNGLSDRSIAYREPVYNTPGEPKSGIREWKSRWCIYPTEVDPDDMVLGEEGSRRFYAASGKLDIATRLTCRGDVCLILRDGCNMTVEGGVVVNTNATLTIYPQDALGTGALTATGAAGCAGIGGDNQANGTLTINGGTVTARGSQDCAGIGGGSYGEGRDITINGGVVTATGGSDSGIGGAGIGGSRAGGRDITINGGVVTATAGDCFLLVRRSASCIGAGSKGLHFGAASVYVATNLVLKADSSTPPTTEIPHGNEEDIASKIEGRKYGTIQPNTAAPFFDIISK